MIEKMVFGELIASAGENSYPSAPRPEDAAELAILPRIVKGQGSNGNSQKLRGGYYTADAVATFLAEWAISTGNEQVLEPSAGDGSVVAVAHRRLKGDGRITAVELDPGEARKAAARGKDRTVVFVDDFFDWFRTYRPDGSFDAAIGNPPFIRYQDFPEAHRKPAFELMREEGFKPSRKTNAWLPFVVMATRALRPGGRLALILPAELLQVDYAAQLREYLAQKYRRLTIVTFRRLVFSNLLQETLLLLGVRGDGSGAQMQFVELDGAADLNEDKVMSTPPVEVDLDHAREKWIQYYLSPIELGVIREIEQSSAFGCLGDFAEVDVGIVTGRNEFFVMTDAEAQALGIRDFCLPLVGRSSQIPGLVLRQEDWDKLLESDSKCLLMQLGDVDRSQLPESALRYVERGEALRFHEGYKCSIRLPRWWKVPAVWSPDAFLLRQIHDAPRIIRNRAYATCTDTIHRVRARPNIDTEWLTVASLNSLVFAFSEVRGRSYGGGVLELEPREAEALPFPKPDPRVELLPLDEVDDFVRRYGLEAALIKLDDLVLKPRGLSNSEIRTLRGIWEKLSKRRRCRANDRTI